MPTNFVGLFILNGENFERDTDIRGRAAAPKETKAQRAERLKLEKNPWDAWEEVRQFAREGRASVLPEWAGLYFKWWGIYTQGDGVGVTGGVGGEGKATEYFMMRIGAAERAADRAPAARDCRPDGEVCARHRRHYDAAEYSAALADDRVAAGGGGCADGDWAFAEGRLRRCGAQRTGCPLAGLDGHELLDASPLAVEIAQKLTANPEFYNLPRKFKISVTRMPDVVLRIRRSMTWR